MTRLIAFTTILLFTQTAFAARPFVTDDARLTTGGSCQLESWTRVYKDSHEFWALPACNPTGNFEVTFGGATAKNEGEKSNQDYVLQAKTLFKTLETNGWGIGLAVGTVKHPKITLGPNQLGNTYAYIPFSASFNDDAIVIHANLGWLNDRESSQDNTTWGIGGEFRVSPRLIAIAESYGDDRNSPYGQAGLRYSVIPGLFQIDTSLGSQINGPNENRWVSFGIRYTPDSVF